MSASIVPIGVVIQCCMTDVSLHKPHPFIHLILSHNDGRPSSFIAAVQSLERLCSAIASCCSRRRVRRRRVRRCRRRRRRPSPPWTKS